MLNKLIDLGVQNRLMVVLALLAAMVAGVLILPKLNLDAFPDVTNVQVQINTEARGLAAEEVEQLITFPIEAVMYALPDVEEVRSISKTGLSVITVVFREGTDIYFARQLVFERLQAAREQNPEGIGTPEMGPNTSGLGQVYQYILRTDDPVTYDALTLRSLNDWVVKLLLMPVGGVTDVLSFGGEVRQYQVQLDPQRLLAYGLGIDEVTAAVEANNRNAGGWYLDRGEEQLVIRGVGWLRSGEDGLNDLGNIPLKDVDGVPVRVRDVASVAFGPEIRQGAVTMTGRDAEGNPEPLGEVVAGIVLKRMGANTKAAIDGIKERLPAIQMALPDGVTLEPVYDQSDLVSQAVNTVSKALLEAFVLIVIVLMLFLVNLRASFLVLISVPISIGLALMAMAQWGISANLMSLGGLAIAIGMMVDGSVVMMEHIFSHLTTPDADHREQIKEDIAGGSPTPFDAEHDRHGIALRIQEAAREVGRPVFFAVMIIIIVFAPLFSLEGVEGKLFQPMAVSIVLAMVASLFVALIIVPALTTYLFRRGVKHKESFIMRPLSQAYRVALNVALARRKQVVFGAVALFAASLALVPFLGTEFVPELEEGTLNIRVTLAPSSSLDTSLRVSEKLEAQLMTFPEVLYVSSRVGRAEIGGDPEPVSNVEIFVGLKPVSEWTSAPDRKALQVLMEEKMSVHPGLLFSFSQPIATRVDELLSGVKAQLAIKLFGPDLDGLATTGKAIEALVRNVDGTRGVEMEQIAGEAQLVLRPDRDALARYGIPVAQVMDLLADEELEAPIPAPVDDAAGGDAERLQEKLARAADEAAGLGLRAGHATARRAGALEGTARGQAVGRGQHLAGAVGEAAGAGRRFGGDKLTARIGEVTVLEASVDRLKQALPGVPVVVVVEGSGIDEWCSVLDVDAVVVWRVVGGLVADVISIASVMLLYAALLAAAVLVQAWRTDALALLATGDAPRDETPDRRQVAPGGRVDHLDDATRSRFARVKAKSAPAKRMLVADAAPAAAQPAASGRARGLCSEAVSRASS